MTASIERVGSREVQLEELLKEIAYLALAGTSSPAG